MNCWLHFLIPAKKQKKNPQMYTPKKVLFISVIALTRVNVIASHLKKKFKSRMDCKLLDLQVSIKKKRFACTWKHSWPLEVLSPNISNSNLRKKKEKGTEVALLKVNKSVRKLQKREK